MKLTSFASLALLAVACGGKGSPTLPDGGRNPDACGAATATLAVKVIDEQGQPVEGATVAAKNVGTGMTVTATSNKEGTTNAVTEGLGVGTVRVFATTDSLASQVAQVEFACTGCACTVEPKSVTLLLRP